MKIIFNELGVITSIDTTDEPIRQGNVGVNNLIVDFSQMNGVNNLDYACVFTYVRPDKSKINDVIMLSSAENTKYFEFNFSNKWFFELYGDASITVKLLKDNTVLANGEFNIVIEKTSADNEPQITYDEYLHLVESIAKTQQDAKQYTDDSVQALKDTVAQNYAEKTYVDNQLNLCVKLTDIDTDFSLTSTNPIQNKVVSKQIKDINYTIMTMKEELFETILSEIDYKVDYATIYPIPDTLSDDDGTHRVVYSDTQLKEVEGNSVAFNQLFNPRIDLETSINGLTFTYNNETGVIHVQGTATANTNYRLSSTYNYSLSLLSSHTYLLKGLKTSGSQNTIDLRFSGSLQNRYDTGNGIIFTGLEDTGNINLYVKEGETVNFDVIPQFADLTLMGLDNITSVEEFNRIFSLTYYPYNAGEIKSTIIKGVKVNGYNALSLDRTTGTLSGLNEPRSFDVTKYYKDITRTNLYDKDNPRVSNVYLTNNSLSFSTNSSGYGIGMPVNVLPNTAYTFSCNVTTQNGSNTIFAISYYDKDGNYISNKTIENTSSTKSLSVTTPNNAKTALLFFSGWEDAGLITYTNICFHLTGSRTGYAPYKEPHTIQLPQTKLLSAGSVHDTIKFVEGNIVAGQQRYDMVQVSRINSVDLGTLNWTWQSANNRWFTSDLSTLVKVPTSNDNKANIIAEKYEILSFPNANTNLRGMALTNSGNLFYYTSDSTNAPSGILNYEKVEPTETTLATDLTFEEVSAIIEQGGSIETVFEIVPPNLKTAFVVNKVIVS